MKENTKAFYRYAKSHSVVRTGIPVLLEGGRVIVDDVEKANAFQEHFSSVYSDPMCSGIKDPSFVDAEIQHVMLDDALELTENQIIDAIADMNANSSAGPDGIPALLLKKCAVSLAYPLVLMWQESFDRGLVPEWYKLSHVCPLHKKGGRACRQNYRPVSLTSHVIKVFERVLRKMMVDHLEKNKLLSNRQHGFRSGRSTLTQLLGYFNNIYEGLRSDKDTDSIYLDYAKAFDKVDHRLLLLKLEKYGFNHKLIAWVRSFLHKRSQVVLVNGLKSRKSTVLSMFLLIVLYFIFQT